MRAAGGFGWLGVAIVTAILAGSPTQGGGCARCGGSMAAPEQADHEPEPTVVRTQSLQSGRSRLMQRQIWRDAQQRRKATSIALGSTSAVCVRSCDGGFFPVPYVGDRNSLAKICQAFVRTPRRSFTPCRLAERSRRRRFDVGLPYASLANAGKFEQAVDRTAPAGGKGQGWAEALAGVEEEGFSITLAISW